MNITSDVNKNIDLFSNLKNEGQNPSILNTLFSINFESDVSSNINTDQEFIFKDDEVVIINYLSNFISNFENENKNLSDINKIKKQIEIDTNINSELKENILNFLREEKFSFKDFNVYILKKRNMNNKKSIDHIDNQKHLPTNLVKNESTSNKITENNFINKDHFNNLKTVKNLDPENQSNKRNYNGKDENLQFVKKIKKNNHPNKIYQLPQSNMLKYKQLNEINSQVDQKLVDNNNFHLISNKIIEGSRNSKLNEI